MYLSDNFAHEIRNVSIVVLNGQVREVLDVLHVLILRNNFFSIK